ncbi:tetratricopeptide repeat protein [Gemmata sp. G18]|uniref:Tetratricopeptide repeat protein n=1 Tax=Gemmata palustris TaxID=2822762 RepID=A0ABS5C230_9BACT|nr:tetratricopeptide repeat protein [Gemmata palustris]MBP3960036.1 tetratricopeptide repeat protein [Gemmata palustris]
MSKRVVAALIIVASLFCAAGFIGLIVLMKTAGERRDARRAEEQARERAEVGRELARERETGRAEAAAAFADPQAPAPAEAREFAAVLDDLGRALQKDDGAVMALTFDADRLFDELRRSGAFDRAAPARGGPPDRSEFVRSFREKATKTVFPPSFRWQHADVRHVRWSADRNEAVAIATHTNDSELMGRAKIKVRWWFVRGAAGWQVYDFEELKQGPRLSAFTGALFAGEAAGRLPAVRAAQDAAIALSRYDLEGAEDALAECRNVELPAPVATGVCVTEAMLRIRRGDPAAAHEFIDRATQLSPGMPILEHLRATCFLATGEHENALVALDAYAAQLGADEEAEVLRGRALEGLKRLPEAKAAYRRAHDLDPDDVESLIALRRVLSTGELKELGARLARASNPRRAYDRVLQGEPNEAADDVLLDALRTARPDDPRGLADDIRRKVKTKKFDDAKKLLAHGLKVVAPKERPEVLSSYLFAMDGPKELLGAYASVPTEYVSEAFRTWALGLDDEESNREGGAPTGALVRLKELVAAHRTRVPNDPWGWFYQGVILQYEKQYDKAAEAFATGGARLPKAKVDDPDGPDGLADDASQFRGRRVECLFQAKKGLEAYEKVEPTADVFQQLARLYDQGEDFDGLAALLAAHRKRTPNDPQTVYWQGHLSFRKRDYAAATVLFKKFLLDNDEKTQNRWMARDEYVRATLRTKPADAAKLLADFEEPVAPALRAAIAAATSDRPELERLLVEATKRGGKLWFYSDEDFRRAFNQEPWSDLRRKYPDPNPPPKVDD